MLRKRQTRKIAGTPAKPQLKGRPWLRRSMGFNAESEVRSATEGSKGGRTRPIRLEVELHIAKLASLTFVVYTLMTALRSSALMQTERVGAGHEASSASSPSRKLAAADRCAARFLRLLNELKTLEQCDCPLDRSTTVQELSVHKYAHPGCKPPGMYSETGH